MLDTANHDDSDILRSDNGTPPEWSTLWFDQTTPWPIQHFRVYCLHSNWQLSEHRKSIYSSRSTSLCIQLHVE